MRIHFQKLILGVVAAMAAMVAGSPASAEGWPEKPVKIVNPFSPGAAADAISRLFGAKLSAIWGQPVIVESHPGASSMIGAEYVARQPADGYTILLITPSFIINATGLQKPPYDSIKDFAPISMVGQTPFVLVAHPSVPVGNVKEMMALAKAKPNQLNFSTSGVGSPNQLGMEMFKLYDAPMTAVPYSGANPALVDLIAGHVQFMQTSIIAAQPLIKQGKLKALGVTSLKRSQVMPDVPAIAETIPGYEVVNWWGFLAPAGTPAPVVGKIAADLKRVLDDPEVKARLATEGAEPVGNTPAEFATYIRDDIAKWTRVVKATNVQSK